MTIEAELHDGRVLEFPDGTSPAVVQATVKKVLGASQPAPKEQSLTMPANAGLGNFAASTLGLPVDTIANLLNLGIAAYGTAKQAVTGKPGPDLISAPVGGAESIRNAMRSTGMPGLSPDNPNPKNPTASAQYDFVSRGGFIPGGALPAAGSVIAEKIGGPQWAGVGAMVPGAVSQAASVAKNAITDKVRPQLETYAELGTTPSVGQATKSNFVQGMENVLSRFPGGQGIFRKFSEKQQEDIAANASTGVSTEKAGRTITQGITGEGGFLDRTKATWQQLDDKVAAKVPAGYQAPATNTVSALDSLTAPVAGAEKTTGALVNPKIAEISKNLTADIQANGGTIPFDALRALRSKVGSMLDESLVSGIPNGELKRVYGALSKDLEAAANQAGAGAEFTRQSNYYKARMDRVDGVLNKVLGKNRTDAQVFDAFNPKNPDESSIVTATMRSLKPEERQIVTDAVVNRLGRAAPGRQDAMGDTFSTETFLTNWNKMSPGAKAQIFPDTAQRNNLNALANVADDIRAGSQVFKNTSGTAAASAPIGLGYLAARGAADVVTGNLPSAAVNFGTAGGMIAGSYIGSKMLTSPEVVGWLAKSAKATTVAQQQAQLGRLGVIYNQTKDEALRQELGNYINSISNKTIPQQ